MSRNVRACALLSGTHTLDQSVSEFPLVGFVSRHKKADFRALRTEYAETGGKLSIPPDAAAVLKAQAGDEVALTPLVSAEESGKPKGKRARKPRGTGSRPKGRRSATEPVP